MYHVFIRGVVSVIKSNTVTQRREKRMNIKLKARVNVYSTQNK